MSPSEGAETSLRDAWEAEARNWVAWAREPGHDSYWQFHRDRFLELLPSPAGLTLDVGCGEGRLPRDLKARGYEVIGVDASTTLIEHAREADPDGDYRVADAASLPLADASVQLVTAFMSLHDIDDMESAVREAARVLVPGGRLCAAVVHPINSAGKFASRAFDAPFIIQESYFDERRYADVVERGDLRMTFTSRHRPLQAYIGSVESAGMLIERVVEIADTTDEPGDRWQRLPLFLQIRAVKPGRPEAVAEVEVRRTHASEWRQLRALRLQALRDAPLAFGSTFEHESTYDEAEWKRQATSAASGNLDVGVAAVVDGEWVAMARGYIAAGDESEPRPRVWLISVYVHPNWRRRDLGRAVSEVVVAWARERGAGEVLLHVADWNDAARRLYEAIGFVPTGEAMTLPHNPTVREIEMRLSL